MLCEEGLPLLLALGRLIQLLQLVRLAQVQQLLLERALLQGLLHSSASQDGSPSQLFDCPFNGFEVGNRRGMLCPLLVLELAEFKGSFP